jgi:hypothetical protein
MQAVRTTATVSEGKTITVEQLPFPAGARVEVIILPEEKPPQPAEKYPLRGTPVAYKDPTKPVAESDWEAGA